MSDPATPRVQARFYVRDITRHAYNPAQVEVVLAAVSRGSENKTWATATPSGTLTMHVSNPSAADWFNERLGKDVAITFEDRPADELPHGQEQKPATLSP